MRALARTCQSVSSLVALHGSHTSKPHVCATPAGDVTSSTHPAGFTITDSINAAQQVTAITSTLNDSTHPSGFVQSAAYTPFGTLATLKERLRRDRLCAAGRKPTTTACSRCAFDWALRRLRTPITAWCTIITQPRTPPVALFLRGGTGNNGSVMGYYYQDTTNPSLGHTATYGFDALNRLTSAVATGSSTYNLTFAVGRYANMTCQTNGRTQGLCTNLTFNVTTNHITTSGYTYDAAVPLRGPLRGMTADGTGTGSHTYQWDAEGRLLSVDSGATENETYNAVGQLAQFSTPTYVSNQPYDPAGQFLGQYNSSGGFWWEEDVRLGGRILAYNLGGVHTVFLHKDALGTSRQATGPGGGVLQDQLFYPWGQSWQSLGTWQEQGFAAFDYLHTSDNLYPTPFRNYASVQGRWLSPDPFGGNITNPQSLNRYAYVLNNPTSFVDPLGLQGDNNHCTIAIGCREPGVFPPPAGGPPGGYPGLSCTVDGISVGCGSAFQLLNAGSGGTTVTNSGGFLNFQVPIPPGAVQSTLVDPTTGQPISSSAGAFYQGSFETVSVVLPGGGSSWWGAFGRSFVQDFSLGSARQAGESVPDCATRAKAALLGTTAAAALDVTSGASLIPAIATISPGSQLLAGGGVAGEVVPIVGRVPYPSLLEWVATTGMAEGSLSTAAGGALKTAAPWIGGIVGPMFAAAEGLEGGFFGACR